MTVNIADDIEYIVRRYKGSDYIIAANRSATRTHSSVKFSGLGPITRGLKPPNPCVFVMFEDRQLDCPSGLLTDSFGPFDAHVYRIPHRTAVSEELRSRLPQATYLAQNYPNPFNQSTVITLQLHQEQFVEVAVFDITGAKVRSLLSGRLSPGEHRLEWDGLGPDGQPMATGLYLVRLQVPDRFFVRKMLLLK